MADDTKTLEPEFSCLLRDYKGSEGPVFDCHGEFYMVAPEIEDNGNYAGQILHVNLSNKKAELLVAPSIDGYGGIPAGCQVDQENNIWVADMRLGLLKVKTDGSFIQVAKTDIKGDPMQGCNDCAFDYTGNLWITAPAGNIAPAPYTRSSQEPFGSVYCYTKDGNMIKVASSYLFSNGIAVQHTEDGKPKKLIVAETFTKTLWGYDIVGDGQIENKHSWGKLPGSLRGGPDGMDFDSAGNLLVAHHGSEHIEVFGPEGGTPFCRIKCPFKTPSNVHFRPNTKEVYVTEHDTHGLWMFEWTQTGAKQYCDLSKS